MKQFFISLSGSLVALCLFALGLAVLGLALIGVFKSSITELFNNSLPQKAPEVESGSYLVFDLNANIVDSPPEIGTGRLVAKLAGEGEGPDTLQLRAVTRALRAAARDPKIGGLLLTGSLAPSGYGTGFAALEEIRGALHEFKDAKKPIVAYLDSPTTIDFYLAATADDLVLDPFGEILMPGLATEPMFYAGAFEKYGVGVQVTRSGVYKSYAEQFIRKDLSPENRQQLQELLGDIWDEMLTSIAADRGLPKAAVQALVDQQGLIRPDSARDAKLVSRLAYFDEVIADLKKKTQAEATARTFKQVALSSYIDGMTKDISEEDLKKQPRVAIVYAEGEIVDGEGSAGEVGGDRFARKVRELRQDPNVKAIVLRVNSPGGAVTGSEHLQRELVLAKAAGKPVIVSMGGYAASGGYWISAYGDRIFAEPDSITGSIGVFSLFFDVQKLANDHGVTFDSVQTGAHADMETISRPKTPEELALFQGTVNWIYGEFIRKVAEGRKLDPAFVQANAQGRVWSGQAALKLHLVDQIGGLSDALAYAGEKGGLEPGFAVEEFPRPKDLQDVIGDLLNGTDTPSSRMPGVLTKFAGELKSQARMLNQFNDRMGVYARLPFTISPP